MGSSRLELIASEITGTGGKLRFKSLLDSRVYGAGATIISYEKGCSHLQTEIKSTELGPLYKGNGPRAEKRSAFFSFADGVAWSALKYIDFASQKDYRFNQEVSVNNNEVNVKMTTSKDSMLSNVKTNIFYTYPYRY